MTNNSDGETMATSTAPLKVLDGDGCWIVDGRSIVRMAPSAMLPSCSSLSTLGGKRTMGRRRRSSSVVAPAVPLLPRPPRFDVDVDINVDVGGEEDAATSDLPLPLLSTPLPLLSKMTSPSFFFFDDDTLPPPPRFDIDINVPPPPRPSPRRQWARRSLLSQTIAIAVSAFALPPSSIPPSSGGRVVVDPLRLPPSSAAIAAETVGKDADCDDASCLGVWDGLLVDCPHPPNHY